MAETENFDASTAEVFNRRPGGSRHAAYKDASGAICVWCRSKLARGGVAITASAIEWLEKMDGPKFVRLTNPNGKLDIILPLDEMPLGETRDGPLGIYYIVDLDEVRVPKFTPVMEAVPF